MRHFKLPLLLLLALAFCSCASLSSKRSKPKHYGLQLGLQIPTGDMADVYTSGTGLTFHGFSETSKQLMTGGSLSMSRLCADEEHFLSELNGSVLMISLRYGFHYRFAREGITPIAGLDVGYYVGVQQSDLDDIFVDEEGSDNFNGLTLAPSVGVAMPLSNSTQLLFVLRNDFGIAFDELSAGYFGLNLGVVQAF